jgi:hypothetical protein
MFIIFSRNFFSLGRKIIPVAYCPKSGKDNLFSFNIFLKNLSGICRVIPAPSPVSGSQPQAPLCERLFRTFKESFIILFDLTPLIFATTPTQAQ